MGAVFIEEVAKLAGETALYHRGAPRVKVPATTTGRWRRGGWRGGNRSETRVIDRFLREARLQARVAQTGSSRNHEAAGREPRLVPLSLRTPQLERSLRHMLIRQEPSS